MQFQGFISLAFTLRWMWKYFHSSFRYISLNSCLSTMCFILLATQVLLELLHLIFNRKILESFELFCLHCKSTQIGLSTWPTGQFCGISFTACGCTKRSCTNSALIWSTVRVRLPIVSNFLTCVCLCDCMRIFSGSKMRQSGSEIVLLVAPTCGVEWLRLGECAFVWTGQCVCVTKFHSPADYTCTHQTTSSTTNRSQNGWTPVFPDTPNTMLTILLFRSNT